MTVRVTTLKGLGAGAYYVEQLPNYYLQAGEPRGRWLGEGAGQLGLRATVDDDAFLALMEGMQPGRTGQPLGRPYGEASVRGFDVTCSAPKSVSVLFALGDPAVRRHVVEAHDAAVAAVAGWIERHAHTRYRIGGEVAIVDAQGIVAAAFRQHTSRALDPQLHTHLVIANRVKSPDGRWLALDARLIKHDQRSLSALYHAGLRAELTSRLNVRWHEPEHGIAEIVDVPAEVLAEFSSRTADVRRRIDAKLDRFLATMGREPTPRERWRLEREAAVDSRPGKARSVDAVSLHALWADQVVSLGHDPAQVATNAIGRTGFMVDVSDAVAGRALDAMGEVQSTWRPTQLQREVAAAVPTTLAMRADKLVRRIDALVDDITKHGCVELSPGPAPGVHLRRDGRPVSESILDRALTTQGIVDQEAGLIRWVDRRLAYDGDEHPAVARRGHVELGAAQAQAAAAVAGSDDLVLVVGPAGTGKTTALAPAIAQLRADGRAVFGVAPSAAAAEVLGAETGVRCDTLDKLLVEHQMRRAPDPRYALPVGATVIVDEAGMVSTAKLAALADLADVNGWRVVLVGDPLQFSAVGRGGMFGLLVDTFGAVELDRVRRFTNDWERDASLRLRRGDVEVADVYDAHGRLHGGTQIQMERAAVERWWELRHTNRSELLLCPTNDGVERLNRRCQQLRAAAGEIDVHGPGAIAGNSTLHVGDEIATRHNDRRLLTDTGDMVRNRATWTVTAIHPDGALDAVGRNGTVRLPTGYVAAHVDLAYACTAMGAQGRTVSAAVMFADGVTDVRNLYVAMTRGSVTNEAFLVTTGEQRPVDVFARCLATDWIDQPAHVRSQELTGRGSVHRPGLLDGPALRQLLEARHAITAALAGAEQRLAQAPIARKVAARDVADAEANVRNVETRLERAQLVVDRHDRPFHRRRHTTELDTARRDIAYLSSLFSDHQAALTSRTEHLGHVDHDQAEAAALLTRRPQLEAKLDALDERLGPDLRIRTRIARLEQPVGIVALLGERPAPSSLAQQWDRLAGQLHQHQAAFGISRGLGPRPDPHDDAVYAASWRHLDEQRNALAPTPVRRSPEIEPPSFGLSL